MHYTILHSNVDFYTEYYCYMCFYVPLLCKVVEQMCLKSWSNIHHFVNLFKLKQWKSVKINNITHSHQKGTALNQFVRVNARWLGLYVHHCVSGEVSSSTQQVRALIHVWQLICKYRVLQLEIQRFNSLFDYVTSWPSCTWNTMQHSSSSKLHVGC
jgi:hypothetical protein